jgi:hypothetical protein
LERCILVLIIENNMKGSDWEECIGTYPPRGGGPLNASTLRGPMNPFIFDDGYSEQLLRV